MSSLSLSLTPKHPVPFFEYPNPSIRFTPGRSKPGQKKKSRTSFHIFGSKSPYLLPLLLPQQTDQTIVPHTGSQNQHSTRAQAKKTPFHNTFSLSSSAPTPLSILQFFPEHTALLALRDIERRDRIIARSYPSPERDPNRSLTL